ncbi:hypothetical protein AAG570_002194, partial [Ranatra chinensis]
VGNIPYEATEEKLKDIFNEVGPVLSFKLVYDRETGKPKGYGFCEYKDQETALSAMRNLNGYEIGGRSLRVDNACTEKSRLEMQSLLAGPPIDNTYGEPVDADKAPEEISKAVASLPPEQMFELMKQMKLCIQNNPAEGKQMLLQNPQLAYALLQAQVVMRIVDPQIAVTMLHKANPSVAPLQMEAVAPGAGQGGPVATPPVVLPPIVRPPDPVQTPVDWTPVPPPPPRVSAHPPTPNPHAPPGQDMDMRALDPRGPVRGVLADQDLRIPPMVPPPPTMHPQFPPEHRLIFCFSPPVRDPRERFQRDPRIGKEDLLLPPQRGVVPPPAQQPPIAPQGSPFSATIPSGATDQEKAALIMQVLQLSDEQIAMLPPEQRQSILILKEQIAKSTQR